MGKEIKISLAVITVLLGGMGYALYRQFAPTGGDQSTENQTTANDDASGSASSTEAEQSQAAAESTRPTVVAATPGSPDGTLAASTSTDPWAAASSNTASPGQEAARTGSSGFSYMPQAVPAAGAGRYATGYGSETSGAATSNSWSTDQGTASTRPAYDPYRTYTSQSTRPTYPSSSTPSAGTGGPMVQSPSASAGAPGHYPADEQTGYPGYQYPASQTGSASGTSGTNTGGDWSGSAGYSGTSDSHGSYDRQDSLPNQYGAGTSGVSTQSSASHGANRGSQYGTSSSYGQSSSSTTTPATPSATAYPANSTSTYSAYADDSPSTYGSSATAATTGQSSAAYSSSSGQNSFGPGNFGRSSSTEKAVIEAQPQEGMYLIQPNDSYWTISQRLYGTGAYFRALAEHNRNKNPDTHQLRVGDEIEAPSASTLEAAYPRLCPKPSHREAIQHRASVAGTTGQPSGSNVYTVQAGDTLFDIARYELGKASRWVEIYQLNRQRLGKNFDYLTPGLQLAMPLDQSTENVTQQPGVTYRR